MLSIDEEHECLDLDAKIKRKLQELEKLDEKRSIDSAKETVEFKVPKSRVKRVMHLNSAKSMNKVVDNIRYTLDGLKSSNQKVNKESLEELLTITKDHAELIKAHLNEICSFENEKILLIVVLALMDVLRIESLLEISKGMSLIKFSADISNVDLTIVHEFFEEFGGSLVYNDLMIWLLSRYCMSCELQGKIMHTNLVKKLGDALGVFGSFSEKSQEVLSALIQFWITQNHKEAIDAIANVDYIPIPAFKKIVITATGFIYGAKTLFEKCFYRTDLEDDLDLTIAINYVDRFLDHRMVFMGRRKSYADALQSDATNQKLALLVGFLYETDASKQLDPLIHAAVKAACKDFLRQNAKNLDEDSLNALGRLLKSL